MKQDSKKSTTEVKENHFDSIDNYVSEIKRLLLEKSLRPEWVDELVVGDWVFVERAFEIKKSPLAAAFEIYLTEEDAKRDPAAEDSRLKIDVSDQAKMYLQQLVKIGLWGDTVEGVAVTLIQQQLALKLEAGLFRNSVRQ